jgi:hypothetical protein
MARKLTVKKGYVDTNIMFVFNILNEHDSFINKTPKHIFGI